VSGPSRPAILATVLAAAMLFLAALAVPPARAATIYACVKKKTGAARIVSKRARCRRGETRLFWNVSGPAGTPGLNGRSGAGGANGASGANGANGAVAGFTAGGAGAPLAVEKETVVLSKVLPAGSYLVSAKVTIIGELNKAGRAVAFCLLADNPGTEYKKEEENLDLAVWLLPFQEETATRFVGVLAQPLEAAVQATGPNVLSLVCIESKSTTPGAKVIAGAPVINAVQTSHNE
jgi:hypothetical protein